MTSEQNKKIIQRLFNEGMNERKFEVFDELINETFLNHGMHDAKPGPKGFRAIVEQLINAFPDMKILQQEVIAEGDTVATRGYWTGTHKAEFMGISATGRKVKAGFIDFWTLSNGKCVENWVQMDMPGVMQQLQTKDYAL